MEQTIFGMDPTYLGYLIGMVILALIAAWRAK